MEFSNTFKHMGGVTKQLKWSENQGRVGGKWLGNSMWSFQTLLITWKPILDSYKAIKMVRKWIVIFKYSVAFYFIENERRNCIF